jgi:hypothetical protein
VEIAYVTVIGLGVAAVLRYLLPGRQSYGMLLLPAVGAVVSALLWTGLTWLGWTPDNGWMWTIAIAAAGIAAIAVAVAVPRLRARGDQRRLVELSGGRAA